MICAFSETTYTSLDPSTICESAISPVFLVNLNALRPKPPRPCLLYSDRGFTFPLPSLLIIISKLSSLPTSIATTRSPVLRDIPFTPPAVLRLTGRSLTENLIPMPCSDTKIMSSSSLASFTETTSSSPLRFIIIKPEGLIFSTSSNLILFTLP